MSWELEKLPSWELQKLPMNKNFKLTEETVKNINESRKHFILNVNSVGYEDENKGIPVLITRHPNKIHLSNQYALYFKDTGELNYYGGNFLDTIDRLKNVELYQGVTLIGKIVDDNKILGGKCKTRRKKSRKNRRKSNRRYR